MATRKVDDSSLTAIANALRTATKTSSRLTFPDGFVSAIENLSAGGTQTLRGTATIEEDDQLILTITDVPFTVDVALVWHAASYNPTYYKRGQQTLLFTIGTPDGEGTTGLCYDYKLVGSKGNAYAGMQVFQNGTTVYLFADACYNGPYEYVLLGH